MDQSKVSSIGTTGTSAASIADRLERLPFSSFHRKYLFMVTAGEFVETLMLLGNGIVLALVATVLHLKPPVSTYLIPVAFFAGEAIGSIGLGYVADRYGRKLVFRSDLLIFGAGMILAGFMNNPALLAVFIVVGGIGVGGEFPLVDSYTSEMFPGRTRGRRMATVYTISVLAAPIIAALTYWVSQPTPGPYSWKILFWIMGVAGLVVWVTRFKATESPRWYEARGRYDEADQLMTDIESGVMREHHLTSLPELPPTESVQVQPRKFRYREIFAPDLRRKTIMMLVFQFFQSGIFYGFTALAPAFLLIKGISLVHTLTFSMIIYAGFFFGSVANMFIIDKVERKWGIVSCALIAGVLGTVFAEVPNVAATVILGFLTTFVLWNFSNFLHTYQAEIFPTRVRASAAGLVYSVSRISTSAIIFVISTWFLPHGLLVTFALIWVFIVIVVVDISIFGPKTSRLRVEEIGQ